MFLNILEKGGTDQLAGDKLVSSVFMGALEVLGSKWYLLVWWDVKK